MANTLEPREPRVGLLVDGVEGTPHLPAMLRRSETHGTVRLTIPFHHAIPEYAAVSRWFREQKTPASLQFADPDGTVTLTDLRWGGYRGSSYENGTLIADTAIFDAARSVREKYRVTEMMSNMDGLTEWSSFQAVVIDHFPPGPISAHVEAVDDVTWRANGFSYRLRENAPWSATHGERFEVRSEAVLLTRSSRRATVDEHLIAQWPVRALLTLLYGKPVRWRRHRLRDQDFPTFMNGERSQILRWVDVTLARTAPEKYDAPSASDRHTVPTISQRQLGSRGAHRWVKLYSDGAFSRAVEPAVEVINGAADFLEPQVMMVAMALDAMGYYLDSDRAPRTPMWRQIQRCIAESRLDYSSLGPATGIAKLIADTNNDLKHPDRASRPSTLQLHVVRDLGTVLFRGLLHRLLQQPTRTRGSFSQALGIWRLRELLQANGAVIEPNGSLRSPNS